MKPFQQKDGSILRVHKGRLYKLTPLACGGCKMCAYNPAPCSDVCRCEEPYEYGALCMSMKGGWKDITEEPHIRLMIDHIEPRCAFCGEVSSKCMKERGGE